MSRKGITEIIAIIMMVAITLALVGIAYTFITGAVKPKAVDVKDTFCIDGKVHFSITNLSPDTIIVEKITKYTATGEVTVPNSENIVIEPQHTNSSVTDNCGIGTACTYMINVKGGPRLKLTVPC